MIVAIKTREKKQGTNKTGAVKSIARDDETRFLTKVRKSILSFSYPSTML